MSTIFCPQCGAPNTIDSAFCASCGASLEHPTETPPTSTTYEQPELLPDGEPVLVNRNNRYHKRWQEKRFNELLALWEEKVAEAERNA